MNNTDNQNVDEMSFLQHLELLRWHLIRGVGAIFVVAIIAFLNKSLLFDTIIFGPKQADFISFQVLCDFSAWLYETLPNVVASADVLCIGQDIPDLQNIDMAGQFTTHIMVSLVTGFIVAFPYLFWEIWRFIKPGLHTKELKYTRGIVFWTWFLFSTGVLFGYFLITPLSINFLSTYSVSPQVHSLPSLSTYISTVTMVVLSAGILFELPILVYFLTKVGLITPEFLKKYRRHFFVVALIVSAIITPPDVFSQILVCLPLVFLYEISIKISASILKQEQKAP